jgi:hypothetical protein
METPLHRSPTSRHAPALKVGSPLECGNAVAPSVISAANVLSLFYVLIKLGAEHPGAFVATGNRTYPLSEVVARRQGGLNQVHRREMTTITHRSLPIPTHLPPQIAAAHARRPLQAPAM